jgi:hypothetical protein
MTRNEILQRLNDFSPEQIAAFLNEEVVTEGDLLETGLFARELRIEVRAIQSKQKAALALELAKQEAENTRDRLILELSENRNKYDPEQLRKLLDKETLEKLCNLWGIDSELIIRWQKNDPEKSDKIPRTIDEVPLGYTDIFFWGIPGSGKSCALSALFYTLKTDFVITSGQGVAELGASYRKSLTNAFQNDGYGYLPESTEFETTQYMPFKFKEKNSKYFRKTSFFELSGELFKHIKSILEKNSKVNDRAEKVFNSLNLVLSSDNEKIHCFFIDYAKEKKAKRRGVGELGQEDYLEAAATYFKENAEIFKRKTKKIYIVVTKADLIEEEDKKAAASSFLDENFSNFIENIKHIASQYNIAYDVIQFSIGDVYCNRICKLNSQFPKALMKDLAKKIDVDYENRTLNYLINFFRS